MFFDRVVHQDAFDLSSPLVGGGRFNLEAWLLGKAGLNLTRCRAATCSRCSSSSTGSSRFVLVVVSLLDPAAGDGADRLVLWQDEDAGRAPRPNSRSRRWRKRGATRAGLIIRNFSRIPAGNRQNGTGWTRSVSWFVWRCQAPSLRCFGSCCGWFHELGLPGLRRPVRPGPLFTMIRKAFVMQVHPGQEAEYARRHQPIWDELAAVLAPTARTTTRFSSTARPASSSPMSRSRTKPAGRPWRKPRSARLVEIHGRHHAQQPDHSPVASDLTEVFHLD